MRLAKPYAGSGRTVVADSGFGCVAVAIKMLSVLGLFLLAMVKTAHRLFPKDYLLLYPYKTEGQTVTMKAEKDGVKLFAAGWNDKKVKTIVATCGTTLPGGDHRKRRWRNSKSSRSSTIYAHSVPRTKIFPDYFNGAQFIDVHNRRRQSSLRLESIKTHSWRFRLFCTVTGMAMVDSFLAYFKFHSDGKNKKTGRLHAHPCAGACAQRVPQGAPGVGSSIHPAQGPPRLQVAQHSHWARRFFGEKEREEEVRGSRVHNAVVNFLRAVQHRHQRQEEDCFYLSGTPRATQQGYAWCGMMVCDEGMQVGNINDFVCLRSMCWRDTAMSLGKMPARS